MKTLDVASVISCKDFPGFVAFRLDVDRHLAARWFSCVPHVDSLGGLGDADYWAVEFDCGLKVAFEFLHHGNGCTVFATEPVPQHVERHLSHWRNELNEKPAETFERGRSHLIEKPVTEIPESTEIQAYQLWRQGDDGNQVRVGFPTSLQDAQCWQAELESHQHKQMYWISRVIKNIE